MSLISWEKMPKEKMAEGLSRRFFHATNVTMALFDLKKGVKIPAHSHPNEQLTFVMKGELKCIMPDKEVIIGEGEVLYIPPNVEHGFEALKDTLDLDVFSPKREDWEKGADQYLRSSEEAR